MAFVAPLAASAATFLGSTAGIATLTAATAAITAGTAISNGNYQAAVARNNAQIAAENAARMSEASQIEAQRSDIDYRTLLAEQLAAQGASGFDILGRSQLTARKLTQRTGRRAAADIIDEGTAGARRGLQEAANFKGEARQARTQGYMSGVGALAQGALETSTLIRGRRPRSFERRNGR